MKKNIFKKILVSLGATLLSVIVILVIAILCLWHNEIATFSTIELKVEAHPENRAAPVYMMDVKGGYYFDDFLEQGGASNDAELIDFIVENLTKGIIPIKLNAPTIGCSSFTCSTSDGTRYFGRNYDFSTTTTMIVRTNPGNGRYASISTCDLQFLGITDGVYLDTAMQKLLCLACPYIPLDGINEKGVACGIYMTYQGDTVTTTPTNQQTSKPDITSTTMLRMILDYASSVEEAVELVKKYDLHDSANTSFHYMVADSTGKSAILEWVGENSKNDLDGSKRQLNVIYNDNDSQIGTKEGYNNFQYVTNFIVSANYFDNDENKKGLDRYNEIERMINPDGTNTEGIVESKEYALSILQRVGRRNWDKVNGKTDANGTTVHSCLFDLTNKTVTWVSNEEFDNPGSVFTFDFSYIK